MYQATGGYCGEPANATLGIIRQPPSDFDRNGRPNGRSDGLKNGGGLCLLRVRRTDNRPLMTSTCGGRCAAESRWYPWSENRHSALSLGGRGAIHYTGVPRPAVAAS